MSLGERPSPPPAISYRRLLKAALREDLGAAGDVTSSATVPAGAQGRGRVVARAEGRVAGLPMVAEVFRLVDAGVRFEALVTDGSDVAAGDVLAIVSGAARSLLAGERVALNLLGHLSGVATATRQAVGAAGDDGPRVVDTRKTTPGLRALEKYAVRAGGGGNHRFGLYDAILVKDNHIALAGGVGPATTLARAGRGHTVVVEVEVDSLAQLEEALAAGADVVLLDNMGLADLGRAVDMARGRAMTEASGGITAQEVTDVAATGVDVISLGWITHSAPALDVALEMDPADRVIA